VRYRPFTASGQSISAISLSIGQGRNAAENYQLICSALECGVNAFSFAASDEGAAEALRQAVAVVGRRVLILVLRLDIQGPPLDRQVRGALDITGATYLDAAMLDHPAPGSLSASDFTDLDSLRASRRVVRLGLAVEAAEAGEYLDRLDFDILAMRYNVCSGWPERNLLKNAAGRGMTVLGYGYQVEPEDAGAEPPDLKGLARLLRRAAKPPMPKAYDFLKQTPGWSSGQITLAYALTEPALASVLIEDVDAREIEALSHAVETELPAGVAAQIEIARFAAGARSSVA
jgi:aryl-alcohol dehydrogenase-like predicted oxidoreductase